MRKTYIGIDIGLKGAIVEIDTNSNTKTYHNMPVKNGEIDPEGIYQLLQHIQQTSLTRYKQNPIVLFERLGVIFKSSKATAFSMGRQAGIIEGFVVGLGLPHHIIPPKIWQKEMFNGIIMPKKSTGSNDTKAAALIAARRLYPGEEFKISTRKDSKDHDGIVDALLLCEYAKRKNL